MTGPGFTDETLMAFADGELSEAEAAAVERAVETDQEIAARVALFRETRSQAKAALGPLADEPVPADLLDRISTMVDAEDGQDAPDSTVVAFEPSPATSKRGQTSRWAMPLAASLALIVGATVGFVLGTSQNGADDGRLRVAILDQPGIVGALNSVRSGEEQPLGDTGDRFRSIASYRDQEGTFCREFEVDRIDTSTIVAVACRPAERWQVQFAVVAGSNDEGYAPASSLESLEAYLSAGGASAPLSLEDESAALETLD